MTNLSRLRRRARCRYVYNHSKCGRCGSRVSTWDMNARKVYACETCQPLRADTVITPARAQALRAGRPTKVRWHLDARRVALDGGNPAVAEGCDYRCGVPSTVACSPLSRKGTLLSVDISMKVVRILSHPGDLSKRLFRLTLRNLQVFVSHCAPDDNDVAAVAPAKLTVAQLKGTLKGRGLNTAGAKPALIARLEVMAVMALFTLRGLRTRISSLCN